MTRATDMAMLFRAQRDRAFEAVSANPHEKPFVNHINNAPSDNRAENLEWCTQAENLAHMTSQGRRASPWAGKRNPAARLTDEVAAAIRQDRAASGLSYSSLAKKWGLASEPLAAS